MGKLTKAQQDARMAILRDVDRSGGSDRWPHLHSHGHHYGQVMASVRRGDLDMPTNYNFTITAAGRAALEANNG